MEDAQMVGDGEWRGFRRLLNCGHYSLADVGFEGRVGQLTACDVCPLRREGSAENGRYVSAVRVIVGIDQVWASQPPDHWDPEHWHGGS